MAVDAISLQVYANVFASVAEEMGVTLQRSAFSPNIRERLDYSCAVFDGAGRMVAQAAHIPVHLGSMPASVRAALGAFERFEAGDVVVLNNPYQGGSHLPDITMVSPVVVDGVARFFVASRAHHADVGGMSPGSLPLSTELYQEGVIIPPIKLVERGVMNAGVMALLVANSRGREERIGDFEAQLAANRLGASRLAALSESHGLDVLDEHVEALIAYARRLTERVIEGIPDGVYRFGDVLEGDGQRQKLIGMRATVTVRGGQMVVDFSGTSGQVAGNVNTVAAVTQSAVFYSVRLLSEEEIPVNDGCFAPIEVNIPEASLLNARFPAAVAVGNTETSQRVVDCVLGALALALPERVPAASQGTMNNVTMGGQVGGKAFVYYETIGGGHGASASGDGLSGRHSHMTNTRNTPVEVLEAAMPIRVREYRLREGSGGVGVHRGGEGIRRVYELRAAATVTINAERRRVSPYGVQGGKAGETGVSRVIRRRGGVVETLAAKASIQVGTGDIIEIETPGGGGWGVI
jgi:N-methylhydantoinase B